MTKILSTTPWNLNKFQPSYARLNISKMLFISSDYTAFIPQRKKYESCLLISDSAIVNSYSTNRAVFQQGG